MDHQESSSFVPEGRGQGKLPPPAPTRRASAKKTVSLQVPRTGNTQGILEETTTTGTALPANDLDDADRDELDALERQQQQQQQQQQDAVVRKSSDSARALPVTRPRKTSGAATPTTVASLLGAPQVNAATTPRPFGEDLPTPNIISRDLTALTNESSTSVVPSTGAAYAGGVTSAGLVNDTSSRSANTGPILCVLGCGTMGRSILSGVLDALEESRPSTDPEDSVLLPPARFIACVRREDAASQLRAEWGGEQVQVTHGAHANAQAVAQSDYVLLGAKPQVAKDLLLDAGMAAALHGKVLISILAGTTIAMLQTWCPNTKIIRVMPNTPSRIRQGMSVIVTGPGVSESSLALVSWIFRQVGQTLVMDEKHIDAATAMCGSGPAFMAVILESMTDGGVMMGIPRAQAEKLAAQTMLGTASMVQAGQHPALIRNAVATPGGCTIGGLLEMEDGKIRSTMARTIQTATNIAAGLGKH